MTHNYQCSTREVLHSALAGILGLTQADIEDNYYLQADLALTLDEFLWLIQGLRDELKIDLTGYNRLDFREMQVSDVLKTLENALTKETT